MRSVVVETILSNLWVATLLAAAISLLARRLRWPALIHGLWIVVLVKLVMPPIWAVEIPAQVPSALTYVLPQRPAGTPRFILSPLFTIPHSRPSTEPFGEQSAGQMTTRPTITGTLALLAGRAGNSEQFRIDASEPRPITRRAASLSEPDAGFFFDARPATATASPPRRRTRTMTAIDDSEGNPWRTLTARSLFAVWLSGALLCLGWSISRMQRFHALMRLSNPAPLWLHKETERLAAQIGLTDLPQVWLVPGPVTPMLWSVGGVPRLLFPAELMNGLDREQRETLLLHELAHLHRKDHRVRVLELLTTALYWWHPLIWWARREVHAAEEACCDAWVVSQLPQRRRTYAEAILRTIDFMADYRPVLPPAASGMGIGKQQMLRGRLTAIMQGRVPREMPGGGRLLVAAVALSVLPLVPTIVDAGRTRHDGVDAPAGAPRATTVAIAAEGSATDWGTSGEFETKASAATGTESPLVPPPTFSSLELSGALAGPADDTAGTQSAPAVMALNVTGDEKYLATAHHDGQIRIWSLPEGRVVESLLDETELSTSRAVPARALAFSPDSHILCLARDDGKVLFWNWQSDSTPRPALSVHERRVTGAAYDPSGSRVATCGEDRRVCLWDVETRRLVDSRVAHDSAVRGLCWSPDGTQLATCGDDGFVHLWAVHPLTRIKSLKNHGAAVRALQFSKVGHRLASADEHGHSQEWSTSTGQLLPPVQSHGELVWSLAYSAEGRWLATGGFDGTIVLRDLVEPTRTTRFAAAENLISGLAILSNGTRLLTSSYDGSIKLWSRDKQAALEPPRPHPGILPDPERATAPVRSLSAKNCESSNKTEESCCANANECDSSTECQADEPKFIRADASVSPSRD